MESFNKCLLTYSQVFDKTNESIKSNLTGRVSKVINEFFKKLKRYKFIL
jgi:hypothetical protein